MLVTLDFETYYDTKVSLTKLTVMEYIKHPMFKVWGVGIKIEGEETEWFGEDQVEDGLNDIDWEEAHLLCHNTPFDGYLLTQLYGHKPKRYLDTAALSRGLWPGQSASLKSTAERCFPDDPTMRKGEELVNAKGIYDLPPDIEEDIAGYCIQDVDLTYAIYMKLCLELPDNEWDIIDLTTRLFCEPKIVVNLEKTQTFLDKEKETTKKAIEESGLERAVLASNQKFAAWAESQGLTVPTKVSPTTGKSIPAFGKNDAAYRQWQQQHPEYAHVFAGREAVKSRLNETRAQRFINSVNAEGCIPSPLKYYAAHTGRFGGTEKINLQNLPRNSELRKVLEAPEGKLMFVADLSNIESRMLAWLADQHNLLELYEHGADVYSNFASSLYNRHITKEDEIERFVGKTAILGLGYGMGAHKFMATLKTANIEIPFDECLSAVNTYRSTYAAIPALWERSERILRQATSASLIQDDRFAYTYKCLEAAPNSILLPNGMALKYHDLRLLGNGKMQYQSHNKTEYTYGGKITENIIQALSRIVICDQMMAIQNKPEFEVVLTVHDEIVAISDEDGPDEKLEEMLYIMRQPPKWALTLPLDAEGGWDKCYSK
tara:strand:+ start:541 stop:2346 length:1806 start_codon:yes stop_codon:yes gene_type:complete